MKKILLTGSNGLLATKIIAYLEQIKYDPLCVLTTSKGANRNTLNIFQYLDLDVTEPLEVAKIIEKFEPNCVIHTAAMTNVDACESSRAACLSLNVTAVKILVDLAQKSNFHLIHLSTDFIFDGIEGKIYSENDTPNPLSFYGLSKLKAEEIITEGQIHYSILRTAIVYGFAPHITRNNIVLWIKKSLENKQPINIVEDQYRNPTFAEDLAKACVEVALHQKNGIFNVVGDEFINMYDLALRIAKHWKLDESLIKGIKTTSLNQSAKRPAQTHLTIEKAKKTFHYEPLSFEESFIKLNNQLHQN